MTKTRVLNRFLDYYEPELRELRDRKDRVAMNELFWIYVDTLVRSGTVTQSQWQRWANPF